MFLLLKYVGKLPFDICYIRACLKNHSRNLHAPLCGIFHPNSVVVARVFENHSWHTRRDDHEKRKWKADHRWKRDLRTGSGMRPQKEPAERQREWRKPEKEKWPDVRSAPVKTWKEKWKNEIKEKTIAEIASAENRKKSEALMKKGQRPRASVPICNVTSASASVS